MKLKDYILKFKDKSKLINIVGPLAKLKDTLGEPVIYVDGGTRNKLDGLGFSVGDNDSYAGSLDDVLCVDKDLSDFAYVLNSIEDHFDELNCFGFLGERKDHELMNLMEVHQFLTNKKQLKVNLDNQVYGYSAGTWSQTITGTFSVIAFKALNLEIQGDCKYKVNKNDSFKHLSSNGLSNEGQGVVSFKSSGPFFVLI